VDKIIFYIFGLFLGKKLGINKIDNLWLRKWCEEENRKAERLFFKRSMFLCLKKKMVKEEETLDE
jgi:hypothetical protein